MSTYEIIVALAFAFVVGWILGSAILMALRSIYDWFFPEDQDPLEAEFNVLAAPRENGND